MPETPDPVDAVSRILHTLRPMGLWYSGLTTVVCLTMWCFQAKDFDAWPQPLRCLTWGWLVISCCAPVYVAGSGAVQALISWWGQRSSGGTQAAGTTQAAVGVAPAPPTGPALPTTPNSGGPTAVAP
jgi:hypothetical protein